MSAATSPISIPSRWISVAALALWLALVTAQMGWLPFTEFAWAYNFWRYFPDWIGWLAQAAALALCVSRVRDALSKGAGALALRFGELPGPARDATIFVSVVALLWVMRERMLIADSFLLYNSVREGWLFVFPDVGATFFMRTMVHADVIPLLPTQRLQLAYCVCGGIAALLAIRVARRLGPGGAREVAIVVLLVSTAGFARIFAGHVETYSVVLCAVLFYFWMALAYIEGDVSWWLPCLALGIAGWLHLSALYLVPSLALLPRIASPQLPAREWLATLVRGAPIAMSPMIAFWLVAFALGYTEDIERGLHVIMEVVAGEKTAEGLDKQWWVRIGGEPGDVGLDYVFLGWGQLKYLANSAHVLMPFAGLIIASVAIRCRTAFGTPAARLLLAASLPTIVYAFMLRPFWGPFDWDLFAITACCISLLAGHLLITSFESTTRAHVATCLLGFQILFVGLPFLVLGIFQPRDAGPFFGKKYLRTIGELRQGGEPKGALVPWL